MVYQGLRDVSPGGGRASDQQVDKQQNHHRYMDNKTNTVNY